MDAINKTKAHVLDDLIAVCAAHGLTDEVTSEIVGSSARTVRRRRKEPEVSDKVAELVAQRAADIDLQLSVLGKAALEVFEDAMSPEAEMSHRLSGANSTMRHMQASRNTAELELRVSELEALLTRLKPALDRLNELAESMGADS
jgi:hypothetical protein